MGVLCGMAVFDTDENRRTWQTATTLACWGKTVNHDRHQLVVVDNGSCEATKEMLRLAHIWIPGLKVITLPENVGTARAINKAWKDRRLGQHCLKVDNDVWWSESGWLDKLEECVGRDSKIGIVGLKRKDCIESPDNPEGWYQSKLKFLPHNPGERWIAVEECEHVMGTCQLYSSALLDVIGYLYQYGGLYGYDDSDAAARCRVAGFYSCFLHGLNIDHIDPGTTDYQKWKTWYSGVRTPIYRQAQADYESGSLPLWRGPEDA